MLLDDDDGETDKMHKISISVQFSFFRMKRCLFRNKINRKF